MVKADRARRTTTVIQLKSKLSMGRQESQLEIQNMRQQLARKQGGCAEQQEILTKLSEEKCLLVIQLHACKQKQSGEESNQLYSWQ